MKTETRLERILHQLQETGSVSVDGLSEEFGVSVATVRRDLKKLEKGGMLHRTHGGATMIEPLFYEPFRSDSSFQEQVARYAQEKRRIGLAAAELVKEGDTIALTPGTTTLEVVRGIRHRRNITVITNTVNVAMELSKRNDLNVFVTGGYLRGEWFSLVGGSTIEALRRVFVDKVFIGANGIDAERGLTVFNAAEAEVNRVMIEQAREKIAVADHSKLGVVANFLLCRTEEVDLLITDSGASEQATAAFEEKGVKIHRA